MAQERLQKILAAAGVASRRKAEELITAGRIEVNGTVVTELGTKADPHRDTIRLDGVPLKGAERPVYLMLHKPKGYVTTVTDPEGRPTVMDLIKGVQERLFPVGRLDYLSEGLLLLTNDGELMQKLTHASSHVPKTYQVKVAGKPSEEDIDKLRAGILLPPEPTRAGTFGGTQEGMKRRSETVRTQPAQIELSKDQENPWYEVTLTEGRNRQIRRMFEQIRHHVEKIKRVRYGTLELNIEPGQWRALEPKEVAKLRASIGKPFVIKPPRPRRQSAPREQRELSPDAIRELRNRAAGGDERPQERSEASPRPPRPERTRFERGRAEPRVGRMRGDRDRREGTREEGQRRGSEGRPRYERPSADRPKFSTDRRPSPPRGDRPKFSADGRTDHPKFAGDRRPSSGDRPKFSTDRRPSGPRSDRPKFDRPERPRFDRGERPKFASGSRPPGGPRSDRPKFSADGRTDRPKFERSDRPRSDRPRSERPDKFKFSKPRGEKLRGPGGDRPKFSTDRPKFGSGSRPPSSGRSDRPSFGRSDRPKFGGSGGSGAKRGGARPPRGKFGTGPKRRDDRPGKRDR
jgi:23S rRNA pseudouridine2605 synthase